MGEVFLRRQGPKLSLRGIQDIEGSRVYLWVRKNPWRRKGQPTPVFLPGELLNPTQRLTFWARQKAAMPKGQKQHSMEKTAKPRWSWGSSGERGPPPPQSESLSLDETSCGQETA